jgi:hypothetical protein
LKLSTCSNTATLTVNRAVPGPPFPVVKDQLLLLTDVSQTLLSRATYRSNWNNVLCRLRDSNQQPFGYWLNSLNR